MKTEKQGQHTPGPWTATRDKHPGEDRYILNSKGNGNFGHFQGWAEDGVTMPEEDAANAALIAAAPDLAAALADAVRAMDAWSTAHPDAGGVFGLLTQARAALAKAGVAI